jgi:hypothetical protein
MWAHFIVSSIGYIIKEYLRQSNYVHPVFRLSSGIHTVEMNFERLLIYNPNRYVVIKVLRHFVLLFIQPNQTDNDIEGFSART